MNFHILDEHFLYSMSFWETESKPLHARMFLLELHDYVERDAL